jgi:quinol monooxygenase YgiN
MNTKTVRVVATIKARPEKAAELTAVLTALIAPTRQEKGCISYELLQHKTDPCDFVFVEEWAGDAALDAHLAAPHLQEAIAKATPLLASSPDIRRYFTVA